jgi:hypothetical protein
MREPVWPNAAPCHGLASATAMVHSRAQPHCRLLHDAPIVGEVELRLLPRWRFAHKLRHRRPMMAILTLQRRFACRYDAAAADLHGRLLGPRPYRLVALRVPQGLEAGEPLAHAMARFFLDRPAATPAADLKLPRSSSSPALLPAEEDLDVDNKFVCHRSFWIDARDLLRCACVRCGGHFIIYGVYQESVMTRTF